MDIKKDEILKRRSKLSLPQQELLKKRLRGEVDSQSQLEIISKRSQISPAPLSFAQQRLWFLHEFAPDNAFYNESAYIRLNGLLDVVALERSLNEIVRRHEALRTTFATVDEQPVQIIHPILNFKLPIIDFIQEELEISDAELSTGKPLEQDQQSFSTSITFTIIQNPSVSLFKGKSKIQNFILEEVQRPFDLNAGPLVRVALLRLDQAKHLLLLVIHHIVIDGWSIGVFFRELKALYEAFSCAQPSPLPELPLQYADFAIWQRQWLDEKGDHKESRLQTQLTYWQQQLKNLPILNLPTDQPRTAALTFKGAKQLFLLPKALLVRLEALSQQEDATLFMTLLAAFGILLYRYTGQDDIPIGSPIANRNREEIEKLIGFFVNTLVLRADLSGNPTFQELLGRIRQVTLEAYTHQDLPFAKLVEELEPGRDLSRQPLFQVGFVLQNAPMPTLDLPGLSLELLEVDNKTSKFDLTLLLTKIDQGLSGTLEYSTDLFDKTTIFRMLGHFQTLLEGIMANPKQRLSDLPLLTEAEYRQLVVEWNDTQIGAYLSRAIEEQRNKTAEKHFVETQCTVSGTQTSRFSILNFPNYCIHQLFEAQVERSPDAIAIVFADQQLTYRELNQRANKLAHYLQKLGVAPQVLVGICMERSPEMVVGLLGILKAGGAYVPLDPAHPQERLTFMLEDAQVRVLLTQQHLAAKLLKDEIETICLDTHWQFIAQEPEEKPVSKISTETLAYVIYTSGSTGRPKGTLISHSGLVNYLAWCVQAYSVEQGEGTLVHSSIAFDMTITALFSPLLVGSKVNLVPEDISIEALCTALRNGSNFSLVKITPAHLKLLSQQLAPPEVVGRTRAFVIGGENLSSESITFWQQYAPDTALINEYGPTETVVGCCVYWVTTNEPLSGSVPIGRPIINTQLYILDRHQQPVAIGVTGELYISGAGLAWGYLNQPSLTAEKFVPNPFHPQLGMRMYKTGDLARYLLDGTIEYLGRIDHQVKIRGFRIELGEIEAVLNQHQAVRQSVVLEQADELGNKRLVGYVVQNPQQLTSKEQFVELQAEQISQWEAVFNESYHQSSTHQDSALNLSGWNSSYTGLPIREEEMCEWVDRTVERILSLQPSKVLEIGCGTGLLLLRIAPHCSRYWGTDFSKAALNYLQQQLQNWEQELPQVKLFQKRGDDFEGVEAEAFDMVIINSVVQYFPSIDYLLQVLAGAVKVVEPGGFVFVGDVRSLPLLEAFHASVQLNQASASLPRVQLQQRVQKRMAQEEELVIDPAFFLALKQHLPQVAHVQIQPKRGGYQNELTKFRYDVILHVGGAEVYSNAEFSWLDWQQQRLTLSSLRQLLEETQPEILGIIQVPNARLLADVKTVELLEGDSQLNTAGDIAKVLQQIVPAAGVEPEDLWGLCEDLPYTLDLSWSGSGVDGNFDAVFKRRTTKTVVSFLKEVINLKPWNSYTNNPLQGKFASELVPQLRVFLQAKLPDYMVPVAFVMLEALPLTSNGKLDRRALPAPDTDRPDLETNFVAPRTPIEEVVSKIWSTILQIEQVGIHDNFFDLGGHSLLATQVVSRLREAFQIDVPLRKLFEAPTVASLAQSLKIDIDTGVQSNSTLIPLQPVSRDRDLPLSFAQQRLWFLNQVEPNSSVYNIPGAICISGKLNVQALEQSLNEVVKRHEALRTTFAIVDGKPVQVITPSEILTLPLIDLRELPETERETKARELTNKEAAKPFDLEHGPLLRVTLLQLDKAKYRLLVTMHHIVSDGWSKEVLVREVATLYEAFSSRRPSPLPELPIQYADFAVWQQQWLQGDVPESQMAYWLQQLEGAPRVLELATDHPRPAVATFQGARYVFQLSQELSVAINKLSQQQGSTLFMTLLAAFMTLLWRYTGQEDIVIGSPIANRNWAEIEGLIGFFVNTLVLRANLAGNPSFEELLKRVREMALGAYAHQDLPFEKLVEELQPQRDLSHTPLFQVMFALENVPMSALELPGLTLNLLASESGSAKFDLTLFMTETAQGLVGTLEYNTDLFEESTISRMAGHLQTLLSGIVANPRQRLSELPLLTQAEKALLVEWNKTQTEYPQEKCIHQLFETQVEQTPDAIAVVFEDEQLTYRELNQRANQLAHYLRSQGVKPEVLVGICVERSLSMVIALLAILKAGGAYVPIDPSYPQERLAFILEDAQAPVLLTTASPSLLEIIPQHKAKVVCLDADWQEIAQQSQENLFSQITTDNLAYVIYTSGSTGRPKGVMIKHASTVAMLDWANKTYTIEARAGVLASTSICFDLSVFEVFVPLSYGGKVILIENALLLPTSLTAESVTLINTVPSVISQLFKTDSVPTSVQTVNIAGEPLHNQLVQQLYKQDNIQQVFNLYGPSEDTTYSTCCWIHKGATNTPPIGRPIHNTQTHLLDENLQPVPLGVPGIVYIGGAGLASGYLNQFDLTAQKFIPNPHTNQPGERLYNTGDLARYLPNGDIEYIGRIDYQVKVRGFRIELGEIEAVIIQHLAVQETVVVVRDDSVDSQCIVAYVVPQKEETLTISELRSFLESKLPGYMVPSSFVILETLPLTPNRKVDRKALPATNTTRPELEAIYQPPQTELEQTIADIWQEVLNVENVGIHDNFFELGGHSLLLIQVHSKLQKIFPINLLILDLFRYPTIGSLAEFLSRVNNNEAFSFHQTDTRNQQLTEGKDRIKQFLTISKRVK